MKWNPRPSTIMLAVLWIALFLAVFVLGHQVSVLESRIESYQYHKDITQKIVGGLSQRTDDRVRELQSEVDDLRRSFDAMAERAWATELEDDSAFEGEWELVARSQNGGGYSTNQLMYRIEAGRWSMTDTTYRGPVPCEVRREKGCPWPKITITPRPRSFAGRGPVVRPGVYRLHGDRLTIAYRIFSGPDSVDFRPSAGLEIEEYRRRTD